MKLISRLREDCFCAFCKSPRRVYAKKHVDLTNVLGVGLLSLALSAALWGDVDVDPRGVVVFSVLIFAAEIFVYLRWRTALVCRLCGFDPIVYKKSHEQAARLVKRFFQEKASQPEFWLSKSPLLQVHRQLREQERLRSLSESRLAKIGGTRSSGAPGPLMVGPRVGDRISLANNRQQPGEVALSSEPR